MMNTAVFTTKHLSRTTLLVLLSTVLSTALCSLPASASDDDSSARKYSIETLEYTNSLKVRGWQVGKNVYFGHAKVAGKYGMGFVIDQKTYAWGINNRGISIAKRF